MELLLFLIDMNNNKITNLAILSNNDNDAQPVIHIRFNARDTDKVKDPFNRETINEFIEHIIDKFKLKGLDSVSGIPDIPVERNMVIDDKTNEIKFENQYMIYTIGTNLIDIRYIIGIDILNTISTDIETFVRDILLWIYKQQGHAGKPKMDRLLSKNTGIKTDQIKAQDLVLAIQGLANSFALNDMYGGQLLEKFDNPQDFINSFVQHYEQKTQEAVSATKFDKAATPEAQKRAADTKNKLIKGLDLIKTLFQSAQN